MINRKKQKKTTKQLDPSILTPKEHKQFLQFLKFQSIYENLKSKKPTSQPVKDFQEEISIPDYIFKKELSTLESVCKYLRENLNLKNKKISGLINKSSKSIWQAYHNSKKKHPKKFTLLHEKYLIPSSILKKRKSVIESIVIYLKEELNLSYHEIALLLKRNDRTIWTVYNRIKKKNVK